MDKWFTEQYEGILDSVDNIEHKALLKALLVSDESVSQIAARLGVPRHRIYSAAYQHFGKDFIKSRSQRISTALMMGRVAQGAGQGAPRPAPQPGDADRRDGREEGHPAVRPLVRRARRRGAGGAARRHGGPEWLTRLTSSAPGLFTWCAPR